MACRVWGARRTSRQWFTRGHAISTGRIEPIEPQVCEPRASRTPSRRLDTLSREYQVSVGGHNYSDVEGFCYRT